MSRAFAARPPKHWAGWAMRTPIPVLLHALAHRMDRSEEHAVIYALIEIGQVDQILKGLEDSSSPVKRGALIAVQQLDSMQIQLKKVAPLLETGDNTLRRTVLGIYRQHAADPQWAGSAANSLEEWLADVSMTKSRAQTIQGLIQIFASQESVAKVVGQKLGHKNLSNEMQGHLLDALASGNRLSLHESWVAPLEEGLKSQDSTVVQKTIAAVAAIDTARFKEPLNRLGQDASRSPVLRVLAIEAASGRDSRLSKSAFDLLVRIIRDGGESKELSRERCS